MRSLRQHLLLWLLPPLLIVGAVATAGAYAFLERRLTAAYDLDLGDIARTVLPYVHVVDGKPTLVFDQQADAVLRADSTDIVYYAVIDAAGTVVAGERALPHPDFDPGPEARYWDTTYLGQRIRAVAIGTTIDGQRIRVVSAETCNKRDRASRDALLSALLPAGLLIIASAISVLFAIGRGLAPLDRVRRELQARTYLDLRPVAAGGTVEELQPLIQELNEMFVRLYEAQNAQARFIANAAHQLRTPIAGLVTQIELAKNVTDTAQRAQHLDHARESATRLARLAQQVLSLAKADPVSNPKMPEEECDLAAIVSDHASGWLRSVTSRKVELEFDLARAPIRGNAILVGELASNLVDNAARYGATTVKVATRNGEERSVLEVIDDGPGIPIDERTRIFERFRRLDNESTEGSGLGLAIVSEIAERHAATVSIDEPPVGAGTRVTVSFPTAAQAP